MNYQKCVSNFPLISLANWQSSPAVKKISLLVSNVLQISLFKEKAISVYLKIEHRTEMIFFLANAFQKRLFHYQNDQSNRAVQTLVSFPGGEYLHTRSRKRFFYCTLYPGLVYCPWKPGKIWRCIWYCVRLLPEYYTLILQWIVWTHFWINDETIRMIRWNQANVTCSWLLPTILLTIRVHYRTFFRCSSGLEKNFNSSLSFGQAALDLS